MYNPAAHGTTKKWNYIHSTSMQINPLISSI